MRFCPERHPSTGYACCATLAHEGDHYVTNGQAEPPGFYVAYRWPGASPVQTPDGNLTSTGET